MADGPQAVLAADAVRLGLRAGSKTDAVCQCGAVLVDIGAVEPGYVDAMLEREQQVSTAVGNGFAIPHGTDASRALVRRTALAVLQFPEGVDWDGVDVRMCVAIAAQGDEHVGVLSAFAQLVMEPDQADRLSGATAVADVMDMLGSIGERSHL